MSHLNYVLEDTTLRDGEQTPGLVFNKKEKLQIFHALLDIGVQWIEAGIPIMGGEEEEILCQMLERKKEVNLVAWNRGVLEDIKASIKLGFKYIHIGLPTSQIHLKYSVNKNREWLVQTAISLIKYCKDKDLYVSISAEDIGRTELSFLKEYAWRVQEAGADRLRLSDTIGILDPQSYSHKIQAITKISNLDLQCHCHNDYGLAVANTLAGLQAGAKYFHVCINGIGERAGMADLAQMVMILQHLYKIDLHIDLTKLKSLYFLLSQIGGYKVYPWQPIVGENIFRHESGIHTKGILHKTKTFEPFPPELLHTQRELIIGKHTGTHTLKYYLHQKYRVVDTHILKKCLVLVRAKAIENKGVVSKKELYHLYNQLLVHR